MPKIDTFNASGQLGVSFGSPGTLHLQQARPQHFGAEAFSGVSQFGQTLDLIDQTLQHQQERLEVLTLAAEYDRRIEAAKAEALKLRDSDAQQRYLAEQSDQIKASFDPLFSTRAVQATVYGHIAQRVGEHAVDLQATSRQLRAASLVADYDKRLLEIADQQAMTPPGAESHNLWAQRKDLLFGENGLVEAGLLTEADAKKKWDLLQHHYWQQLAIHQPEYMLAIGEQRGPIDDMDRTNLPHYINLARWRLNGLEAERKQAEAAELAAIKQAQKDTQDQFIEKLTAGTLTSQEILASNLEPVGQGSKEHYIQLLEAQARHNRERAKEDTFVRDPSVFLEVLEGIRRGKITTEQEVEDVFAKSVRRGRGISWEDTVKLRAEVDDMRTPEGLRLGQQKKTFLSGVRSRITKSSLIKTDELGDLKFAEYSAYVDEKVAEYRRQKKDVRELFDKDSSMYLGNPAVLAPFQTTMQEATQNIMDKVKRKPATTAPPKRLEKETPEEYLQRIGK